MKATLRRSDLVEPDLSYEIVGVIFDVFREIGPGLKEKIYQKAIAQSFRKKHLDFKEQVYCPVIFQGANIGQRYLDFLVADKIIIELKCGNRFSTAQVSQVNEYLHIRKLSLALLFVITNEGVNFRRIVNIKDNFVSS